MMIKPTYLKAILATLAVSSLSLDAQVEEGQLVLNPFFSEGNYAHWELSGNWRFNGASDNLVFDIHSKNEAGFYVAAGECRSFAEEVKGDPEAHLLRLAFDEPYLANAAIDRIKGEAAYTFYIEVDVVTKKGIYRAQSQMIKEPWATVGPRSLEMKWLEDIFLGDPFAGGGLAVASISSISYKAVVWVEKPATNKRRKAGFLTVDNFSLRYFTRSTKDPAGINPPWDENGAARKP